MVSAFLCDGLSEVRAFVARLTMTNFSQQAISNVLRWFNRFAFHCLVCPQLSLTDLTVWYAELSLKTCPCYFFDMVICFAELLIGVSGPGLILLTATTEFVYLYMQYVGFCSISILTGRFKQSSASAPFFLSDLRSQTLPSTQHQITEPAMKAAGCY